MPDTEQRGAENGSCKYAREMHREEKRGGERLVQICTRNAQRGKTAEYRREQNNILLTRSPIYGRDKVADIWAVTKTNLNYE